jgi:hypothetical protein
MTRGSWVVRAAMAVALAWTVWGMTVMVSQPSDIAVSLHPSGQSLQQVVRPAADGSAVRVRLSSVRTVRIGSVLVADGDADRTVTFAGRDTTTIQAGQAIVSDTIPLPVDTQSKVTISVYLPQAGDVTVTLDVGKAGD